MAKFEVSGPNAAAWLDRIMANRLPKPGRLCLSPMLSEKGRVIGDFTISNLGDRYLIVGTYAMQLAYLRHFRRFLPDEGVTVKNLSDGLAGLALAGPRAQAIMGALSDQPMDTGAFRFMDAREITLAGVPGVHRSAGLLHWRGGIRTIHAVRPTSRDLRRIA